MTKMHANKDQNELSSKGGDSQNKRLLNEHGGWVLMKQTRFQV